MSAMVIAGAGLAGAKAAETLRAEGFDGPVVLIGDETERPYERPPLSKDYLLGKAERGTIFVHPRAWYAEHEIDLRLGARVTGLDPAAHEVTLADGSRIGYAKLLLATGSTPRHLTIAGADAGGCASRDTAAAACAAPANPRPAASQHSSAQPRLSSRWQPKRASNTRPLHPASHLGCLSAQHRTSRYHMNLDIHFVRAT